ncbi:MAG: PAS domain-containing protein [Candidatus Coatesbacteria bacterium]|nr:PAS domain-containing protein [Candidatus Coatesbacteria bacterium]
MKNALLVIIGLLLKGLSTFFYELSGLFFSHFIQFMLAALVLVMVNIERKRTRSKEFVYLTLGFMLLMFQKYLISTVLGIRVFAPDVAPTEEYSSLIYQVLELFGLIILTTAFLYPVTKHKLRLQKIMVYNLLSGVAISLAVFLSFQFQHPQISFADHWGSWLFASLDLVLLLAIIFYTLLARPKSMLLIVLAAAFWALTEVFRLRNILAFGGRDSTLLMLSETVPILVYVLLVIAIYRDISGQYISLHIATMKSKRRLQAIFDGITDGIVTLDKDLKVLNVNESEREFLGLPTETILGRTCYELHGRGDEPCPECPAIAALQSGRKASAAFHVPMRPGEAPSFIEEEVFPLYNQVGDVDQVILYIKDTTERHRIEERMRSLDRLAAVGEMSTRIAHEIRNPLEAISGSAEYLGQTVDSDLVREFTKIIRDESQRLSNLTKSLLNYSTRIQLNPKMSNINYLLIDTKKLLKTEFDEAQSKLRLVLDRNIPDTVFDPGLIKQVIINLLINSLEATDGPGAVLLKTSLNRPGSVEELEPENEAPEVEFTSGEALHHLVGNDELRAREHIAVYCRDFGKGIDEKMIRTIFNPFTTSKTKGSGLGLATSEKIVTEHSGLMEVYSKPGIGTLFVVRLPFKRDVGNHHR